MEVELQQDNPLEQAKRIMNSLMRAQGIEIEYQTNNTSPSFTQELSSYSKFSKFDINSNDFSDTNEEQIQKSNDKLTLFKNNNKVKLKECSYVPLYWELSNCGEQFFIYGGFCVDFTFKIQDDNSLKKLNKQIDHMEYFKKDGILIQHYGTQPPTIKDMNHLIKRARQINDNQYYMLSLALQSYQQEIPTFLQALGENAQKMQTNQLVEKYEQNYLQFQEWGIQEIRKIDSDKMFNFSIHKFNFQTLEFEVKVSGQSKGIMALRGVDIEDPFQFSRKELYHYLDGESNLNLLINQINQICKGEKLYPLNKIRMNTFDRIQIDIESECVLFTNRDEDYPYKDQQIQDPKFRYEFMISMGFHHITPEALQKVIKIRNSRSFVEYAAFEDFTYSMQSQIFLEKYYNNMLQKIQNKK